MGCANWGPLICKCSNHLHFSSGRPTAPVIHCSTGPLGHDADAANLLLLLGLHCSQDSSRTVPNCALMLFLCVCTSLDGASLGDVGAVDLIAVHDVPCFLRHLCWALGRPLWVCRRQHALRCTWVFQQLCVLGVGVQLPHAVPRTEVALLHGQSSAALSACCVGTPGVPSAGCQGPQKVTWAVLKPYMKDGHICSWPSELLLRMSHVLRHHPHSHSQIGRARYPKRHPMGISCVVRCVTRRDHTQLINEKAADSHHAPCCSRPPPPACL